MDGFPRRFGGYVLAKPWLAGAWERFIWRCMAAGSGKVVRGQDCLAAFGRQELRPAVQGRSQGGCAPQPRKPGGVFDAGRVKGEIYLAMEFVEGKDLRAIWNRCAQKGIAFPLPVAAHIVKELVRGLAYAHGFEGLRLVHRDVSPPNVLLSYSGEVKLTDFGLATSTLKLEKTAPGVIFGKISYMAPEQARAETLDGRSDIYSAALSCGSCSRDGNFSPPVRDPRVHRGWSRTTCWNACATPRSCRPQSARFGFPRAG